MKIDNQIPIITYPLGRYWEQPKRENILIDDTHAAMTEETLKQLHDYSHSQPSGVYEGKMWRGSDDEKTWYLKWWSASDQPNMCKGNVREILIIS